MGYDENVLSERGFYLRYLRREQGPALVSVPEDGNLRKSLREAVAAEDVSGMLQFAGATSPAAKQVSEALASWVSELYPTEHLEAAQQNLGQALSQLSPRSGSSILIAGGPSDAEVYLLSAARLLGMQRIGVQHGVHYGFTDDLAACQELEYAFLDEFLTWGWSDPPRHPREPAIAFTPLPSPWLSERGHRLAKVRRRPDTRGAYDVLLMTDKLQRFPPTSTGAGVVRSDALPAVAQSLRRLVHATAAEGMRVLHKPYSVTSRWMLTGVIQELEAKFGDRYTCLTHPDKGLTEELLSSCGVVVWDQPSTGFAECLVSGIPTLVCWSRDYYREAARAAALFRGLAEWGVVHESETSLVETLQQMMHDLQGWMGEPSRRAAVSQFCRACSWTDEDWSSKWAAFFQGRVQHHTTR